MSQAPLGQDGIADVVQDDDVIVHVDGQNGMGQAAQGIAQDDDTQFVRIHAQLFEREIFDDGVIFAVARFFEEQVGPDPVVGLAPVGDILTVRKAVPERVDIAQQFHAAFALRPLFEGIPGGGPGEDLAADEDGLQLVHAADLSPGGQAVERAPELHGPEQGDGGGLRREDAEQTDQKNGKAGGDACDPVRAYDRRPEGRPGRAGYGNGAHRKHGKTAGRLMSGNTGMRFCTAGDDPCREIPGRLFCRQKSKDFIF